MSKKKTEEQKESKKEELIEKLSGDYIEYLTDFDLEELELIDKMNVFTMRSAKEEQKNREKNPV